MSWVERSLDELGFVSRGKSRHRPRDAAHLYGGPYPFVQTGDVKHAGLYLSEFTQTYSDAGLAQSKLWPKGTLCITIAANIADTSILDIEACFPDSVIGFIPEPEKADARFIKYLFDAKLKLAYQQFTQGAAQDNLSQGKLLSKRFLVPEDVNEQTRIADVAARYDDLIENNRRRIQLLEKSARLLYKEWFVQLRFPGHEHVKIIDGVPEGWELGQISDYFDTTSGGTPSRSRPEFYEGDINWVKTQELDERFIFDTEEKITEEAVKNSSAKIFPANSLLVSIYGGTNIGRTGIIDKPSATNQACVVLLPKRCREDYMYMQQWLKYHRSYLIGLSQGAAQTNISQHTLKSLEMLWPKAEIIDLFIEEVRSMYLQIRNLGLQIGQLEKARDILLPRLMSGELAA